MCPPAGGRSQAYASRLSTRNPSFGRPHSVNWRKPCSRPWRVTHRHLTPRPHDTMISLTGDEQRQLGSRSQISRDNLNFYMLSMIHQNKPQPTHAREKEVPACKGVFWTKHPRDLIYLAATCCSTSLTSFNPAGVASRRVGQSGVCVRKLRNLLEQFDVASRTGVQTTREAAFRYMHTTSVWLMEVCVGMLRNLHTGSHQTRSSPGLESPEPIKEDACAKASHHFPTCPWVILQNKCFSLLFFPPVSPVVRTRALPTFSAIVIITLVETVIHERNHIDWQPWSCSVQVNHRNFHQEGLTGIGRLRVTTTLNHRTGIDQRSRSEGGDKRKRGSRRRSMS
ncbi:hypothetical protein BDW75DRAFT_170348 [Aspergillus navahoensis]